MKPLDGHRVISIAINLPGPAAAARLAELGAEVTKIEPTSGDPMQFAQPAAYAELHQSVKTLQLDLKNPAGGERLHELLESTDLILSSSRLAALERLGLGWPSLGERYPKLCGVAIVGYRPPDEHHPGHDLTYQAREGLISGEGLPRSAIADLGGALLAVEAALGLLLHRATHPSAPAEDRWTLVPLADAARFFAVTYRWGLTKPGGVLGGGLAQYNVYQCREGRIALAALEPHFWVRFQESLGLDSPSQNDLVSLFRTKTAGEWQVWAESRDLPIAVIQE